MKIHRGWIIALLFITHLTAHSQTVEEVASGITTTLWAISAPDAKTAWISGSKGEVGKTTDGGRSWKFSKVTGYEQLEFRSLYAFDAQRALVANVGSPAYVLLTEDGGNTWKKVYENTNPAAFIDGLDFWNNKEGLVYGDPIEGQMLLIQTKDGGLSWSEMPESSRPDLKTGEGSFAASGTGIRCFDGNKAIIITGGLESRMFISHDRGSSWKDMAPPVPKGKEMAGSFSVAVQNVKTMILSAGNFADTVNAQQVIRTDDGGTTWNKPESATRFNHWCIEYLDRNNVVAIGPQGGDYSTDGGKTWKAFTSQKGYHVIRKSRKGNLVLMAGNKGKIAIFSLK